MKHLLLFLTILMACTGCTKEVNIYTDKSLPQEEEVWEDLLTGERFIITARVEQKNARMIRVNNGNIYHQDIPGWQEDNDLSLPFMSEKSEMTSAQGIDKRCAVVASSPSFCYVLQDVNGKIRYMWQLDDLTNRFTHISP